MASLPPDYDSDPGRWRSWQSPVDVHEEIAVDLAGPVLDVGCGDGRLAAALAGRVTWVGADASAAQLAANPFRPLVQADMGALPFADGCFGAVTHLWCLYHVKDPIVAIAEAKRVLRSRGTYYASTAARDDDPELLPEGRIPSSFDAEEAVSIVGSVFEEVKAERWDQPFYALSSRDQVRAYCRHNYIPLERAEKVVLPLWLTKRGVLVRAKKH
jgi:SAM-dependent methyltransferase